MAPEPIDSHVATGPLRTHGTYFETRDPAANPVEGPPPTLPAKFDLAREVAEDRARLRGALGVRWATGIASLALAAVFIVLALLYGSLLLFLPAALLLAAAIGLFRILLSISRWPTSVELSDQGIQFWFRRGRSPMMEWTDPKFSIEVREASTEVNQRLRPPKDGPSYRILTGQSSRSGFPRIVVGVPLELVRALLSVARSKGLSIDRDLEGTAGSESERLVYRFQAARKKRPVVDTNPFPQRPSA